MSDEHKLLQGLARFTLTETFKRLKSYRWPLTQTTGTLPGQQLPIDGPSGSGYPPQSHTHDAADLDFDVATQAELDAHAAAADPHAGYQKESEKGAASGYASLDGSTKVPIAQLPDASTTAKGIVELATSAETTAGLAVQASDTRLSDSRTPNGAAGGDLNGTYPSPTVDGLHGRSLDATAPNDGEAYVYNGSVWIPAAIAKRGTNGANKRVAFFTGAQTIDGDDSWRFDSTNKRISIGAAFDPSYTIDMLGYLRGGTSLTNNTLQALYLLCRPYNTSSSNTSLIGYTDDGTTREMQIGHVGMLWGQPTQILFGINGGGSSGLEAMRIASNRALLVGLTSPGTGIGAGDIQANGTVKCNDLEVASTTVVTNLNADRVDGIEGGALTLLSSFDAHTALISGKDDLGHLSKGTSMPGSPSTNQIRFRTDLTRDYYYDGTRWLSRQEFHLVWSDIRALGAYSASLNPILVGNWPLIDLYVYRVDWRYQVATTNDGSNYWSVILESVAMTGGTLTTIDSFNTSSGVTAGTNYRTVATPNLFLDAGGTGGTNEAIGRLGVTKTGSPGNLTLSCIVWFRLVGT